MEGMEKETEGLEINMYNFHEAGNIYLLSFSF